MLLEIFNRFQYMLILCCDVLCHSYVDPASIYRILPQIRIRAISSKFTGYPAGQCTPNTITMSECISTCPLG